jgi:hypothetical protein
MRGITNLSVTQFRIFPSDAVPFSLLRSAYGTARLKNFMGFRTSHYDPESGDLVFEDGAFKSNESSPLLVVPTASFNGRRIVLTVMGTSSYAHLAYAALQDFFSLIEILLPNPIFFTEETICVAKLDFDWHALVSPDLYSLVTTFAQDMPFRSQISMGSISFTLESIPNQDLKDAGVILNDKKFVIEPRHGVPLSERGFFTASPSSSGDHIALLRDLEARLAKRRAQLEQLQARIAKRGAKSSSSR